MQLYEKSKSLRKETVKLMMKHHGSHFGGSMSCIELLVALYNMVLNPEDKFILSKGHACFPLYVLLRERGYNPEIRAHPDIDEENGIYATTGSLGHGIPLGIGMAFARKKLKNPGKIYVLAGDGEAQEGTTWESILRAPLWKLDNLIVCFDWNGIQGSGRIDEIMPVKKPLETLAKTAGWSVSEIDGHDYGQIIPALRRIDYGQPRMIIANTVKGKGISFMEDNPLWHSRIPNKEELKKAYEELK